MLGQAWDVEPTNSKDHYAHFKPRTVLEDFHRFAMSSDKSDRIFASTLIPRVKDLGEQENREFEAAILKLQNDASFKVRHFSRKAIRVRGTPECPSNKTQV
jgi:hypothetical protein